MKMIQVGAAISTMVMLVGCATSPLGRKQFVLFPEGEMSQMGAQSFQQLKAQTPTDSGAAVNAYIRCVSEPLLRNSGSDIPPEKWEIVVFKDETANAFALPGGKIGVHTGLLSVARTDAQLAAVIGHEIGHVIARHGNERVSQALGTQLGLAGVDAVFFGKDEKSGSARQVIMASLGLGTQVGLLMRWGRSQESEADVVGLKIMAKAGFDPRESTQLWKNMMAAHGGGPPEWLSTHPAGENRIRELEANMGPALEEYSRSRKISCRR